MERVVIISCPDSIKRVDKARAIVQNFKDVLWAKSNGASVELIFKKKSTEVIVLDNVPRPSVLDVINTLIKILDREQAGVKHIIIIPQEELSELDVRFYREHPTPITIFKCIRDTGFVRKNAEQKNKHASLNSMEFLKSDINTICKAFNINPAELGVGTSFTFPPLPKFMQSAGRGLRPHKIEDFLNFPVIDWEAIFKSLGEKPGGVQTDKVVRRPYEMPKREPVAIETTNSTVRPNYYGGQENPYEAIKVINAWGLNFETGNALKYISRLGKKAGADRKQDLQKAITYLQMEVDKIK